MKFNKILLKNLKSNKEKTINRTLLKINLRKFKCRIKIDQDKVRNIWLQNNPKKQILLS